MQRRVAQPTASLPSRVLTACGNCCGLKYSACCAIFSLWGTIMLAVLGYLLQTNYAPVHMGELTQYDALKAASGAYGAAGVYAALSVLCGVRFGYLVWSSRRRVQHV